MASQEDIALRLSLKDEISAGLSNITGALGKIGLAFGAFELGRNIFGGIIRDTVELQSQMIDLRAAVQRAGYSWDDAEKSIGDFTDRLATQKGVIDDYSRESLQRAIDYTKDLATAESLVESAADLAAAKHIDLTTATDLLGKAFIGHTETLARYGLTVQKGSTDLETFKNLQDEITKRFGGAAAASVEKLTTKWELLKDALQGINEAAGRAMGAEGKGGGALGNALTNLTRAAGWFAEKIDQASIGWRLFVASIGAPVSQDRLNNLNVALASAYGNTESLAKSMTLLAAHKSTMDSASNMATSYQKLFEDPNFVKLQDWWDSQSGLGQNIPDPSPLLDEWGEDGEVKMSMITAAADVDSAWKIAFRDAANEARVSGSASVAIARATSEGLKAAFRGATDSILGSWKWLNEETNGVLKKMAQDFVKYFVNSILESMAKALVPGILGFLGSLFDTPANDQMARRQGRDFASHFTLGVTDVFSNSWAGQYTRGEFNPGVVHGANNGQFSRQTSQGVVININGNMTPDFIKQYIIDPIEYAARGRFTGISIKPSFATGVIAAEA